ncbi:hypothetical protein [uncultured Cellulomonas sp.]|uniref:hypothetical protein n=1 Tax=uncultured Cellulomonas sp. TaxID=189682 RepID=UPI00261B0629|nr:hypothetical protein [uncultured Cellulomonas sp.]
MKRRTPRVAAALAVLMLTLAGCGSGGADAPGDGDDGAAPEVELGPLEEYFQQAYGEYDEDQANRDMLRLEEAIAACMAEQGFDYTPMDVASQAGTSMSSDDLDVEWGTREFAEQYGYGITTNPFGDLEEAAPQEEFVDPNADYVEAMSESEREAFYVALSGDQVMPEGDEEFVYDWEQSGCQGRAQHEVYEGGQSDPAIASLEEEMNSVWQRTQEDPRVAEATTTWVSCMGDAGITGLTSVEEASMRISDKSNAVFEEVYNAAPTTEDQVPSEEDMAALEAEVQERIGELTDEEIATAVADAECREEIGYDDTMREVGVELQQEFVDTHREELDAWVEAVTAARS